MRHRRRAAADDVAWIRSGIDELGRGHDLPCKVARTRAARRVQGCSRLHAGGFREREESHDYMSHMRSTQNPTSATDFGNMLFNW